MKKIIFILSLAAVSLSSCLKDKPNTDFSSIGPVLELPVAGLQYFSLDAITDPTDTIIRYCVVNMASASPLSTATSYSLTVDNSLIAKYVAANPAVNFVAMPAGSYTINRLTGTIPAGKRLDTVIVTFYKHLLDPSQSYMLPLALKSTSNGILSGNFNAHYYHFIGNDFAGTYTYEYTRYNNGTGTPPFLLDNIGTGVLSPVTPTEFQMTTGYNSQGVRYDVTFTRTVVGGVPMYSNFAVTFVAADVTGIWGAAGITVTSPAVFFNPPFNPAGPLTFAQAKQIFKFQYVAFNGSAFRYIIDYYH
jgi:hypothetical protein